MTKDQKKEIDLFAYFSLTLPKWAGERFVTSRQFLKAYKKLQCSDKGYICIDDLHRFLDLLFENAQEMGVDFNMMKSFIRDYTFYMEHKKEYWISLKELLKTIPMIEPNYLLKFRGRASYTSTDFMLIWKRYDPDYTGYLDKADVEVLVFDMLTDLEQKSAPKIHKLLVKRVLSNSDEDGRISFNAFRRCLPVEKNFMTQYQNLSALTEADAKRIFSHYDPDDNGSLSGQELEALIRDIAERNKKGSDLEYILQKTDEMLKRAGGAETGAILPMHVKHLHEL